MIALENMRRVDAPEFTMASIADWNWKPDVADVGKLERSMIEASGKSTTSRNTFTKQTDHGENY